MTLSLPNSPDAEETVIGSVLKNPQACVDPVVAVLPDPKMFYELRCALIYEIIIDLVAEEEPVGISQIVDRLTENQTKQFTPGPRSFMVNLIENVISYNGIEATAKIVRNKYILRQIISAAQTATDAAYEQAIPVSEIVSVFELSLSRIGDVLSLNDEPTRIADIIPKVLDDLKKSQEAEVKTNQISTGFSGLDRKAGGIGPGNLVVIGGWTSQGKTQLALQIAVSNAMVGKSVGIFTMEMTKEELIKRMLLTEAGVGSEVVENQEMTGMEWSSLHFEANRLSSADILIHDEGNINMARLKALSRIMVARKGVDLLIIDYIQQVEAGRGNHNNRQEEVAYLSRSAKSLAMELKIPIIALAQLTDLPSQEKERRPRLRDFRESKAIAHDANKVLFVSHANSAEILIAKNREGVCGITPMEFVKGQWYERSYRGMR